MAQTKEGLIKKALLDQLARNGMTGKHYVDLVNDYMRLWEVKTNLQEDIRTRGTKVEVYTATTVNIKTNDSVLDLLKVNAQMLKILESLGIQPVGESAGGSDADDM